MNVMVENAGDFSAGRYFHTLTRIVKKPSAFFETLPREMEFRQAFLFLLTSSLIFATASLIQLPANPILGFTAGLINGLAMPFVIAAIGYGLMALIGKRPSYRLFFAVCAYSSGTFLLLSWIPTFIWFTEITKWMFIGIGLVKSHGLKRWQAFIVTILSLAVTAMIFVSLASLTAPAMAK